jgi:uncharacterized protein YegJ (DUF2314 family)
MIRRITFAVLASTLAIVANSPVLAKDKTVRFRSDDPEMTAAIKKARATIATFWKAHAAPPPGVRNFALKVAITEPGNDQTEHFWLIKVRKEAEGRLSGLVNNDPNHIKSVRMGQRYTFNQGMISDWMFLRNGKIVGAWTLRVIIKRLPRKQADYYRSRLEKP